MPKIIINGFRIPVRIGCEAEERERPQVVEIHLRIELVDDHAATSGALKDTVCYKETCDRLTQMVGEGAWPLLEQFAASIGALILDSFPRSQEVSIQLRKFVVPNAAWVGYETVVNRNAIKQRKSASI